jgi:hypothetical protein
MFTTIVEKQLHAVTRGMKTSKYRNLGTFTFRGKDEEQVSCLYLHFKMCTSERRQELQGEEISAFLICCYAQALPSILEKDYLPCFL